MLRCGYLATIVDKENWHELAQILYRNLNIQPDYLVQFLGCKIDQSDQAIR
jgi:hypothetical protein